MQTVETSIDYSKQRVRDLSQKTEGASLLKKARTDESLADLHGNQTDAKFKLTRALSSLETDKESVPEAIEEAETEISFIARSDPFFVWRRLSCTDEISAPLTQRNCGHRVDPAVLRSGARQGAEEPPLHRLRPSCLARRASRPGAICM